MKHGLAAMAWPVLRRLDALILTAGGVAALPLLYLFNPAQSGIFPPCPFRWLTGWLCPGCGSLRAVHQLLHGEFAAALALNPLMVALLPLIGCLLAQQSLAFLNVQVRERMMPAPAVWALLVVTLGFAIARNLPAWPAALSAALR